MDTPNARIRLSNNNKGDYAYVFGLKRSTIPVKANSGDLIGIKINTSAICCRVSIYATSAISKGLCYKPLTEMSVCGLLGILVQKTHQLGFRQSTDFSGFHCAIFK